MGRVTEELLTLIRKQVQDHGIVVWYDPEQAYTEVVERLQLPNTTLLCFQGSFFDLRHRMEPFLEFVDQEGRFHGNLETPPRLLIYVPLDREKTQHALIEAESAGTILEPGGSPWQRNTRLKVLAERVFKRIAPDRAGTIAAEVEAGRRTLAELDWLADQTGEFGAIKLIFCTTAVSDVLPGFLSSEKHDQAILNKNALPELTGLLDNELGFQISPDQSVSQVRQQLCRFLLLAELVLKISTAGGDTTKLTAIPVPKNDRQREQILALCRQWRNRLDLRESYAEWAKKIQTEAQVVGLGFQASTLTDSETFPCIELLLLDWIEGKILGGSLIEAIEIARQRKSYFWSLYEGEYQLRWMLLEKAAQLLLAVNSIEAELKTVGKDPKTIVGAYTKGIGSAGGKQALPWCLLDRYHRHLEHRYTMLELRTEGPHAQLEMVIRLARERYAEVVGKCTEFLTEALASGGFEVEGTLKQDEVFSKQLRSLATEGKTAYLLGDALRYEMGQELFEGFSEEFEIKLMPAVAQLPTITEVGMAALMPGNERGMELKDVGGGKVGIRIGDAVLKDRGSRMKHFESSVHGRSIVLKLNDLMKLTKKRQEEIAEADILLITSQEIDRHGEGTDEEEERRFMDEILEKLRRGIRRLASLGVRNIIIAADHGYIFVEELDEAMKIDPPGGQTVDLHPRVWIGRGGTVAPGYIRLTASQLGLSGNLELAFPHGLACFRARGSSRGYFHGGISLQELVIPVATMVVSKPRAMDMGTTTVMISLAKPKITTRFFSIEARYIVTGLFGKETRRVRVVARGNRAEVGLAAMAAYGFEEGTKEIVLERDRPNAITMMLTSEADMPTISVHVLDATTLVELAAVMEIPVEITI